MGHPSKLPANLVLRLPDTEYPSVPANVLAILEKYHTVFDAIQQQEVGVIRRNAAAYSGTSKYEVGDIVWYIPADIQDDLDGDEDDSSDDVSLLGAL